jgi:hypothetical protein
MMQNYGFLKENNSIFFDTTLLINLQTKIFRFSMLSGCILFRGCIWHRTPLYSETKKNRVLLPYEFSC